MRKSKYAHLVESQSPVGAAGADSQLAAEEEVAQLEREQVALAPLDELQPLQEQVHQNQEEEEEEEEETASSLRSTSFGSLAGAPQQKEQQQQQSPQATKMNRSISRSMLQLDTAPRANRFLVQWTNLSYSYSSSVSRWRPSAAMLTAAGSPARPPTAAAAVLKNISGSLGSNQLMAVIGPSGSGKTTFLRFLAGTKACPSGEARLTIDGLEEPKVAFIGQDDSLMPGLTARETLLFASRLQNDKPNFDHLSHVDSIMEALGIADCADRLVTKLSGGQLKRVVIGQELLYPTNLLVLDEITSGLDASFSYSIVRLLKELVSDCQYPMSIVMSIHQPSARLFEVFDRVYLMADGHCLYEGSPQVREVDAYLSRFGLECPSFHNIADFLIEIASNDEQHTTHNKQQQQSSPPIRDQLIQFQKKRAQEQGSSLASDSGVAASCSELVTARNPSNCFNINSKQLYSQDSADQESQVVVLIKSSLFKAVKRARAARKRPLLQHLRLHFDRSLLRIQRSSILTYLQLITYILLGLQLATFYGLEIGTLSGCPSVPVSFASFLFAPQGYQDNHSVEMRRIQENMNFLLVAIMTATFAALEITVITFPLEAKTVKREWRNGWYRVSSYFIGRSLADLPFQLVCLLVFCVTVYTITGQIGLWSWRFCSFVLIITLCALIAQSVGFIFGAIFMNNLPAAVFTAPLCIFPALLFSGFFSRVSQVPYLYRPLTYLSHFRYAFDALLVTLYGFNRCGCQQDTIDQYHDSLRNQSYLVKTTFKALFGSIDCDMNNRALDENSIEDTVSPALAGGGGGGGEQLIAHASTYAQQVFNQTTTLKPLENALLEHMLDNSSDIGDMANSQGLDRLAQKFATSITSMLNAQSNFGHPMPTSCDNFNSFLIAEFDLHDDDLIFGLAMLFVFVILTRLMCNIILGFTIARQNK